ncbi:MAG: DNA-binding response regulator [Nitrospina sp.]|nr:DNA-binding response regulator [Nitrospina sp.]|tara:strand:+ start:2041 stop:2724 length:684 start_codon:yes stop_codon:yes gene_type:complete
MKIKIAVVEDNQTNIDLIRYQLDAAGFDIFVEKTGKKGIKMIKEKEPDLVLLDIGLPDIDGFELCKVLRSDVKTKNYPIIMLTARIEDNDRIEGLKLGADDYITKPYNAEELVLRIKNLLRRAEKYKGDGSIISIKGLSIDINKREVQINKKPISLTFSEYQILIMLVENLGKIIQKKEINKNIFNINEEIDSRTVDTHIHSIRKKIKESECIISTIRSVGFLFEAS